jgi:hypothetical protein
VKAKKRNWRNYEELYSVVLKFWRKEILVIPKKEETEIL